MIMINQVEHFRIITEADHLNERFLQEYEENQFGPLQH